MKLEPRYYQKYCFEAVKTSICTDKNINPLVVIPTGGGKSLIQSMLVEWIVEFPGARILCVTHRKELIKQNYNEFLENSGFLDAGIYSAGLKSRDQFNRVIFAGIQSIHRKPTKLGAFDIVIVDEAHLVPHKAAGMYRKYFDALKGFNGEVIFVGMSATPYRMRDGLLTDGEDKLFDEIVYEISVKELIENGFLSPVITPKFALNSQVDISAVHTRGGEYIEGELQEAYDIPKIVKSAVSEIIDHTKDRNKILVFSQGIEHAEHIKQELIIQCQTADLVHSEQDQEKNDSALSDYKTGKIKYLVNKDILTTGFNEKAIDCIVLLMSTKSPGKYVQIVGRGTRLFEGKKDCLVLDFGSNIKLHGPIDKIEIVKNKAGKSEISTAPQKECPDCQAMIPAAATICENCGRIFEREIKHDAKADNTSQIISEYLPPEKENVTDVYYARHKGKNGKIDTLRATYYNGLKNIVSEWVCIEHDGIPKRKAIEWLKNREGALVSYKEIDTIDNFLDLSHMFRKPIEIYVDYNQKYPKVISVIIEEEKDFSDFNPCDDIEDQLIALM